MEIEDDEYGISVEVSWVRVTHELEFRKLSWKGFHVRQRPFGTDFFSSPVIFGSLVGLFCWECKGFVKFLVPFSWSWTASCIW